MNCYGDYQIMGDNASCNMNINANAFRSLCLTSHRYKLNTFSPLNPLNISTFPVITLLTILLPCRPL